MRKGDMITIELVDMSGRVVATPVFRKPVQPDEHSFRLDPGDYKLTQGLYFARITSNNYVQTLKLRELDFSSGQSKAPVKSRGFAFAG